MDGSDCDRFFGEIATACHENVAEARALERRIFDEVVMPAFQWLAGKIQRVRMSLIENAGRIFTTSRLQCCGDGIFLSCPRKLMANDITRLRRLAEKCDLSQPPGRAVQDLRQLAVTVMCLGRGEDVEELIAILGKDFLRRTLRESPAVLFREKDWYHWHRHLNGWDTPVPPMPKRSLSSS